MHGNIKRISTGIKNNKYIDLIINIIIYTMKALQL